jgi:sulfoxide reductase heme-binding subunit YedZ
MKATWGPYAVFSVVAAALLWAIGYALTTLYPGMQRMALWIVARAAGITTLLLLATLVVMGMVMSQPDLQRTWRLNRPLLPWHRALTLVMLAFLVAHVTAIAADPYVPVGWSGAVLPFLARYRPVPVALGVFSLYFLLLVAVTAQFGRGIGKIKWIAVHRFALLAFVLGWVHGVTTGTDTVPLRDFYEALAVVVLFTAFVRYWSARKTTRRTEVKTR